MFIPRRKSKRKYSRKNACKHLEAKGDISNSLQPLCVCEERDLVLGTRAYVCQVCELYTPQSSKEISEVFETSRKQAEKKIKEKKLALELESVQHEDEVEISTDEFEEEEEEIPLKFEKRKADKDNLEDGEFADVECPFCGELFDDVRTHIQECEFAPEDASIDDIVPAKKKKSSSKKKSKSGKPKKTCPHCGKEFIRLGRHLSACDKNPENQ